MTKQSWRLPAPKSGGEKVGADVRATGLSRRSSCVGDVMVIDGKRAFYVAPIGFEEVSLSLPESCQPAGETAQVRERVSPG